ncbi:hypothetical protein HOLleu_19254 [Holothuria leucospilota]|uniref:Uncharacterized protein n=1 Tax=Holothuria leucospilota TaxID=206669 RepID=A0A9Q1BZD7_HOLLE|nr:hypothetical protein HOLleu_19254 [Holothuria leucospilota]
MQLDSDSARTRSLWTRTRPGLEVFWTRTWLGLGSDSRCMDSTPALSEMVDLSAYLLG